MPDAPRLCAVPAIAASGRPPSVLSHFRTPPSGLRWAWSTAAAITTQSPHILTGCLRPTSARIRLHTGHPPPNPVSLPLGNTRDPYEPRRSQHQAVTDISH